jgi:hypothetical protein
VERTCWFAVPDGAWFKEKIMMDVPGAKLLAVRSVNNPERTFWILSPSKDMIIISGI